MSEIDDCIKGIAFCNKKIGEMEELKIRTQDIKEILKIEFIIKEYTKQLEHFIYQSWQQGKSKRDITDKTKKRYEA